MSIYQDKYGMWHVKPCIAREPSTNDAMIVSAYADKVGLPVSGYFRVYTMIARSPETCNPIERTPGKGTPYPSRDFYLGLAYFRLKRPIVWEAQGWKFSPFPLPPLNIFKLITQLWRLRGKHRNHFWQNPGFEQVYRFAFSIPLQDRAFYYRAWGSPVPLIYRLIETIDKRLKPGNNSSALLRWLKHNQAPPLQVFENYFGKDHPITAARKQQIVKGLKFWSVTHEH